MCLFGLGWCVCNISIRTWDLLVSKGHLVILPFYLEYNCWCSRCSWWSMPKDVSHQPSSPKKCKHIRFRSFWVLGFRLRMSLSSQWSSGSFWSYCLQIGKLLLKSTPYIVSECDNSSSPFFHFWIRSGLWIRTGMWWCISWHFTWSSFHFTWPSFHITLSSFHFTLSFLQASAKIVDRHFSVN